MLEDFGSSKLAVVYLQANIAIHACNRFALCLVDEVYLKANMNTVLVSLALRASEKLASLKCLKLKLLVNKVFTSSNILTLISTSPAGLACLKMKVTFFKIN